MGGYPSRTYVKTVALFCSSVTLTYISTRIEQWGCRNFSSSWRFVWAGFNKLFSPAGRLLALANTGGFKDSPAMLEILSDFIIRWSQRDRGKQSTAILLSLSRIGPRTRQLLLLSGDGLRDWASSILTSDGVKPLLQPFAGAVSTASGGPDEVIVAAAWPAFTSRLYPSNKELRTDMESRFLRLGRLACGNSQGVLCERHIKHDVSDADCFLHRDFLRRQDRQATWRMLGYLMLKKMRYRSLWLQFNVI